MDAEKVIWGFLILLFAWWLLQGRRCNQGCHEFAKDLIDYGLDDIGAGLFA